MIWDAPCVTIFLFKKQPVSLTGDTISNIHFKKTLPKSRAYLYWISVRFYETACTFLFLSLLPAQWSYFVYLCGKIRRFLFKFMPSGPTLWNPQYLRGTIRSFRLSARWSYFVKPPVVTWDNEDVSVFVLAFSQVVIHCETPVSFFDTVISQVVILCETPYTYVGRWGRFCSCPCYQPGDPRHSLRSWTVASGYISTKQQRYDQFIYKRFKARKAQLYIFKLSHLPERGLKINIYNNRFTLGKKSFFVFLN